MVFGKTNQFGGGGLGNLYRGVTQFVIKCDRGGGEGVKNCPN